METNRKQPKRLLCIVSTMNVGGAETFLMKIYRTLDRERYQMDFYCMSQGVGYYEAEIKNLGGHIYHSIPKSKNVFKSFFLLKKTVKQHKYDYVMRISQHSLSTIDLLAAKIGGAHTLIQRSSNSNSNSKVSRVSHKLFKWLPMTIPNIKIAPSIDAAEYTFGKKSVDKKNVEIIKNAISVQKFLFDKEKRMVIRKKLNIDDMFVVGHVGRFNNQKNHNFLIDIFAEIVKENENSILLLVGCGNLENIIKLKVEGLGLSDKVIFAGVIPEISEVMMAMDVFVFPSFYEGMPNTVIEAQATGLRCLISDSITKEANITGLIDYLSLDENVSLWARKALQYKDSGRKDVKGCFIENGYDIELQTNKLVKIIFREKD